LPGWLGRSGPGHDSNTSVRAASPGPRWRVHHGRCDPVSDRKSTRYLLDVGEADTYEKLLSQTERLMVSHEITGTNWAEPLWQATL
jgi:hypothetical protein